MRGGPLRAARAAIVQLGLLLAAAASAMATDPLPNAIAEHCGTPLCPQRGAEARLIASLHGAGAHRSLEYRLDLRCPGGDAAPPPVVGASSGGGPPPLPPSVAVALLQPLPPAVFADIYQLDNTAAVGQGPRARVFGPVDVESIEARAQPTLLAVYANASCGDAAAAEAQQQQVGWACRGLGVVLRCASRPAWSRRWLARSCRLLPP